MNANLYVWLLALSLLCTSCSEPTSPAGPPHDASGITDARPSNGDASLSPTDANSDASQAECLGYSTPESVGRLDTSLITECSGLVASGDQAGILWLHNDSGDEPRVFAISETGQLRTVVNLEGATHRDWEDIAIERREGNDYILVGDIGDNARTRTEITIYRFPEPLITDSSTQITAAESLVLSYEDGASYDAESLAVDSETGAIYILTKDHGAVSRLFRTEGPVPWATGRATLRQIASLRINRDGARSSYATAMDISSQGDRLIIRTYSELIQWHREIGESWSSVLTRVRQVIPGAREEQGEAVAFSPNGRGYLTISEGINPWVYRANSPDGCP